MPWFRAGPVPRPRPEVLGEEGAQRLSLQGRKSWRGRPLIAFSGERAHDFYPLASQKMFCWGAKVPPLAPGIDKVIKTDKTA